MGSKTSFNFFQLVCNSKFWRIWKFQLHQLSLTDPREKWWCGQLRSGHLSGGFVVFNIEFSWGSNFWRVVCNKLNPLGSDLLNNESTNCPLKKNTENQVSTENFSKLFGPNTLKLTVQCKYSIHACYGFGMAYFQRLFSKVVFSGFDFRFLRSVSLRPSHLFGWNVFEQKTSWFSWHTLLGFV